MDHLDLHPALRAAAFVWAALVGAALGSFLNVVIARVPQGRSIVSPGSACPRCGARIAWYDNVPLVSWVVLGARCRGCRAPIPFRYPLVEALGAAAAVAAVARHGLGPAAAAELAFVAALVALAFIDLDTWLLPHAITWPLIAAGVLASGAGLSAAAALRPSALGAGAGFAAFALVAVVGSWVFRREALGWGDVWLLAGIGAWLGARALLPVILLASIQGSLLGLALVVSGRAQPGPAPGAGASTAPSASPGAAASADPSAQGDGPVAAVEPPSPRATADEDWVPPRNAVPFGPFLALAALEWLYLGALLRERLPVLDVFA